jgi:uncharacterized protein (TIGR03067 family)
MTGRTTIILPSAYLPSIFACLLLSTAGGQEPAKQPFDNAAIVGQWRVTELRCDGKRQKTPDKDRYTFSQGIVKIQTVGNPPAELHYRLEPTTTPRRLDMVLRVDGNEQVSPMVYELRGDVLRICYSQPGEPRPTDLTTTAGDRRTLITFARKRPNEPERK